MPITYSWYKYANDSGTEYQLYLTADFATAGGFPPAGGGEPFLPVDLTPRFAILENITGAVVTRIFAALSTSALASGMLGSTITLLGLSYTVVGIQGESHSFNPFPGLFGPAGPPGPPGVGSSISVQVASLPTELAATGGSNWNLCEIDNVTPGTYLALGSMFCNYAVPDTNYTLYIATDPGSTPVFASPVQSNTLYGSTALCSCVFEFAPGSGPFRVILSLRPNTTMYLAPGNYGSYNQGTSMLLVKLA